MRDNFSSLATGTKSRAVQGKLPTLRPIYVYEAPVRIWHWINALMVMILIVTGYFIGSPPVSIHGEASDHFFFGYLRFTHFAAAYILAVGFCGRVYWAFAGNYHAREIFSIPIATPLFWKEFLSMLRWYSFLRPYPNRYIGHNPVARVSMFLGFVVVSIFMMGSGFALYGEGALSGHPMNSLFTSWVIPLLGGSQSVRTWHHLGMWLMVCFVILHIYASIREDIMGRQSMIGTMVNGYRVFKN